MEPHRFWLGVNPAIARRILRRSPRTTDVFSEVLIGQIEDGEINPVFGKALRVLDIPSFRATPLSPASRQRSTMIGAPSQAGNLIRLLSSASRAGGSRRDTEPQSGLALAWPTLPGESLPEIGSGPLPEAQGGCSACGLRPRRWIRPVPSAWNARCM
jgi:hypothetical protein